MNRELVPKPIAVVVIHHDESSRNVSIEEFLRGMFDKDDPIVFVSAFRTHTAALFGLNARASAERPIVVIGTPYSQGKELTEKGVAALLRGIRSRSIPEEDIVVLGKKFTLPEAAAFVAGRIATVS